MTKPRHQSRREFLLASAVGFAGLTRGKQRPAWREESPVEDELFYVGTYTEDGKSKGIYVVHMDSSSGQLEIVGSVDAGANPSYLALHPNNRVLYAVNEVDKYNGKASGAVTAFAIAPETGALTKLNTHPSEGAAPCYVSVDRSGRVVLVANYNGGSVALLPIQTNGLLTPPTSVIHHIGSGPDKDRQSETHAHCILADPSNRYALAADLGADRVFVYRLDFSRMSLEPVKGEAVMKPGAGPRHIVFHSTLPLVYVANELDSTVTTLRFDDARGTLAPVDTHSTLPSGWTGKNYPADIHFSPTFPGLYVSNRGHNSIAFFSVSRTGGLALQQTISTEGDWPRNFAFDASGRWLLVANQRSNSIVVFARDENSGRLTLTSQRLEVPSPVCIRFPRPNWIVNSGSDK